jgi:hypothetical protein
LISLKHSLEDAERRNEIVSKANLSNIDLYEKRIDELEKENVEVKEELEKTQKDLTRQTVEYNLIEFPSMVLTEIESRMRIADKATIQVIIEYLKTDALAIVKNLAQVVNSSNAANAIAYRDGALGRIDALIKKLATLKTIDVYADRIAGKMTNGKEKKE